MAAVTLLTSGAQDKSGAGAAVDVSSYGALRLDATFTYDAGGPPWAQLRFLIEDAPTADGPWRIIEERTRDQSYKLDRQGSGGGPTGDPELDTILLRYRRPAPMAAASRTCSRSRSLSHT